MAWIAAKNTNLGVPEDLVVLEEDVLQGLCQVLVVNLHPWVAAVIHQKHLVLVGSIVA